jgi:hypothetical protein
MVFADRREHTAPPRGLESRRTHLGESEHQARRVERRDELTELLRARDVEIGVRAKVEITALGRGSLVPTSRLIDSATTEALA